jgi:hypothetical protein
MRCKMKLISITKQADCSVTKFDEQGEIALDEKGNRVVTPGIGYSIKMSPVYHNNDPKHENSMFWAYSPGGSFELLTVNPQALEGMEPGDEFYFDITPAKR